MEIKDAVALAVVGMARHASLPERQRQLRSLERLDLRLLVLNSHAVH
jgi:hypothetical protein